MRHHDETSHGTYKDEEEAERGQHNGREGEADDGWGALLGLTEEMLWFNVSAGT